MTKAERTPEEMEQQARDELQRVVGRRFRVSMVFGYRGEDSVELFLDLPVMVRIEPTSDADICRWCDAEWLDPCWNVEILETRPELVGLRSAWVYGGSFSMSGERDPFMGVPVPSR